MSYAKVFLLILSLSSVFSRSDVELKIPSVDCITYWQIKSFGLSQDYSVASPKASAYFQAQYEAAKDQLSARY